MTEKSPKISTFNPIVLSDKRRVTLELAVEDLPTTFSNVMLTMPDMVGTVQSKAPKPDPNAVRAYPNIELSILNSQRQQISSLLIVEHMEPYTALTLHIPAPNLQEQYTARAEMIYDNKVLDVVEVPFILNQGKAVDA